MRDKTLRISVEGAFMVALAFALSWLKIFQAPYGGSVTMGSMIPILLFSFRHGLGPGLIAGVAHGLLQLIADPFTLHPVQVILDYPLAFGLLGLAGLFGNNVYLGTAVGMTGRLISHFLSGVIFFGADAPGNPYVYSILYNAGYLIPEFLISVVLLKWVLYRLIRWGES
jgi:thiamine transporter